MSSHRPSRWPIPISLFLFALLGIALAAVCGLSYTERLSSHAGFHLVTVDDSIAPGVADAAQRPRQAALVVMDGLGYKEALHMRAMTRLAALGQCRKTNVGGLSMSRPVYAVISTGLEQDRTGARNNDDTSPLFAQSIFELARRAGRTVTGTSELPWWQELFPDRFSSYLMPPREANYFKLAAPAELMLIHHVYIDESGHEHGAGGEEYLTSVRRADDELSGFLDTLDLSRDLIVVTADHGHSLSGGHGGLQDRVAHVLTCYAGRGVAKKSAPPPMPATVIAPSLALLLQLPFPAHMRADAKDEKGISADGLDVLWQIIEPRAFTPEYLVDRQHALEKFRSENRDQLRRWLPDSDGSWHAFYDAAHKQQRLPLLCAPLFLCGVLLWRARRGPGTLACLGFMALVFTALYILQVILRGSFDMTSIDHRRGFLRFTVILSITWLAASVFYHLALRRNRRVLLLDLCALILTTCGGYLLHPLVFGWKVGFPLPAPMWIFFPYFATLFLFCLCCVSMITAALFAPRSAPPPDSRS